MPWAVSLSSTSTKSPSPALVIAKLAGGMSKAEVAAEYELDEQDVLAALSYAAGLLNDEQVLAIA